MRGIQLRIFLSSFRKQSKPFVIRLVVKCWVVWFVGGNNETFTIRNAILILIFHPTKAQCQINSSRTAFTIKTLTEFPIQ